jgi:hypothetical protein
MGICTFLLVIKIFAGELLAMEACFYDAVDGGV